MGQKSSIWVICTWWGIKRATVAKERQDKKQKIRADGSPDRPQLMLWLGNPVRETSCNLSERKWEVSMTYLGRSHPTSSYYWHGVHSTSVVSLCLHNLTFNALHDVKSQKMKLFSGAVSTPNTDWQSSNINFYSAKKFPVYEHFHDQHFHCWLTTSPPFLGYNIHLQYSTVNSLNSTLFIWQ